MRTPPAWLTSDESKLLFDELPLRIAILDSRGCVFEINKAWREFAMANRFPANTLPGTNYISACRGGAELHPAADGIRAVLERTSPVYRLDYAQQTPAGRTWQRMVVTPLPKSDHFVVSQSEIATPTTDAEVRSRLLRQDLSLWEKERRQLADELHNGVCQTLTAVLLNLQLVKMARNWDEAQERLAEIRRFSAITMVCIRKIMRSLQPTVLEDFGLIASLQQHAMEIGRSAKMKIDICSEIYGRRLPEEVERALFRIATTALDNAFRHADARTARVLVKIHDGCVELNVTDDGITIHSEETDEQAVRGRGLECLREQAGLFGGSISAFAEPGKGTSISVRIPYSE